METSTKARNFEFQPFFCIFSSVDRLSRHSGATGECALRNNAEKLWEDPTESRVCLDSKTSNIFKKWENV